MYKGLTKIIHTGILALAAAMPLSKAHAAGAIGYESLRYEPSTKCEEYKLSDTDNKTIFKISRNIETGEITGVCNECEQYKQKIIDYMKVKANKLRASSSDKDGMAIAPYNGLRETIERVIRFIYKGKSFMESIKTANEMSIVKSEVPVAGTEPTYQSPIDIENKIATETRTPLLKTGYMLKKEHESIERRIEMDSRIRRADTIIYKTQETATKTTEKTQTSSLLEEFLKDNSADAIKEERKKRTSILDEFLHDGNGKGPAAEEKGTDKSSTSILDDFLK